MNYTEKPSVQGSKDGESSPPPHSDIEVGSIVDIDGSKGGDEALRFLKSHHAVGELSAAEEKKLVRKIDWMIMPLMWSCYCLQYLDKTLGTTPPPPPVVSH
jgi:hypothetical protein